MKSITIVPKYVGRDFDDLDHAVYKAFMLAEKQVDNNKRYKFFTLFENNGGDKPFHVRTTTYGDGSSAKRYKNGSAEMLQELVKRIEKNIQSSQNINFSQVLFTFNFLTIPQGGKYLVTNDKEHIFKKRSVVKIVNNDNNCFWYALIVTLYSNHKKAKEIAMGRNIRITLAKELCEKCGFTWDQQIAVTDIHKVEKIHIFCFDYLTN